MNDETAARFEPIIAPKFYGSSIQLFWTSNDLTILFGRAAPFVQIGSDGKSEHTNRLEPVAMIQISPQTAKDLSLLLAETVAAHEREWGVIRTEYTKARETK